MRYEMKYLCSEEQGLALMRGVDSHMQKDPHGESTIQSLYFDTDADDLILASLDKPKYKEKLRARCYGLNDGEKDVFLEMKRKMNGIVYKRRVRCKEKDIGSISKDDFSQIGRELKYFYSFYDSLYPKMLILYDRTAFADRDSDLRVTFDRNVRYRTEDLNFHTSLEGESLLPDGCFLVEIKTGVAVPLWLCRLLAENAVNKTSFSKYGRAFIKERDRKTGEQNHVSITL